MILSATQAVSTKCRAMYSKLLKQSDYNFLLEKTGVSQVADYLKKQTSYSDVLSEIDESSVHRGQLEHVFKKSLYNDYTKLFRFTTGEFKSGITILYQSLETDDIKLLIGSFCRKQLDELKDEELTYLKYHTELDVPAMLESKTMEALIDKLKDTHYYKPLQPFVSEQTPNFLKLDKVLDNLDCQKRIAGYKSQLSGSSRELALSLCATEIDVRNLFFIYRMKKLYSVPIGDIIANLIPHYHRISIKDFMAMAECSSLQEVVGMISKTYYGFIFQEGQESIWESNYSDYLYHMHLHNFRTHSNDIGIIMAYFFLKENDIRNLITIIEGIRYQMPKESIASLLVGNRKRMKHEE